MARHRTGQGQIWHPFARASRGLCILVLACVGPNAANAQDQPAAKRYQQTVPVLARYPDLDLKLETPALANGRTAYTTHTELETFIAGLTAAPAAAAHLTRLMLGTTPGGRTLPVLLMSKEGVTTPEALVRLRRPIVWLIGQQHGDEPAGGEAMLALARAVSDGELTPLLDRISIVVVPRANPDGAAADQRENAAGLDINRDHGLLTQPETRMLHGLVQQAPPAMVIDAHEFTVGRRWVEKLGGLQAVDLMVLSSTHPMTPEPVKRLSESVFQPALQKAIAGYGITSFVYHTTSGRTGDHSISVGGSAPGIARNAFGLMGAVTFLLETRGVGIGFDSYQRRVGTHYIAARALLQTAAQNAAQLATMAADVRALDAAATRDIVLSHTIAKTMTALPLVEPLTGADRTATVAMDDTRSVTGTEVRARPAGYIIPSNRVGAIRDQLELLGGTICKLTRTTTMAIERYDIQERFFVDRRAINPQRSLRVRIVAANETIAAGSSFIAVEQPAGARIALALEPDAPGSLSAENLINDSDTSVVAIKRVPRQTMTPAIVERLECGRDMSNVRLSD